MIDENTKHSFSPVMVVGGYKVLDYHLVDTLSRSPDASLKYMPSTCSGPQPNRRRYLSSLRHRIYGPRQSGLPRCIPRPAVSQPYPLPVNFAGARNLIEAAKAFHTRTASSSTVHNDTDNIVGADESLRYLFSDTQHIQPHC